MSDLASIGARYTEAMRRYRLYGGKKPRAIPQYGRHIDTLPREQNEPIESGRSVIRQEPAE